MASFSSLVNRAAPAFRPPMLYGSLSEDGQTRVCEARQFAIAQYFAMADADTRERLADTLTTARKTGAWKNCKDLLIKARRDSATQQFDAAGVEPAGAPNAVPMTTPAVAPATPQGKVIPRPRPTPGVTAAAQATVEPSIVLVPDRPPSAARPELSAAQAVAPLAPVTYTVDFKSFDTNVNDRRSLEALDAAASAAAARGGAIIVTSYDTGYTPSLIGRGQAYKRAEAVISALTKLGVDEKRFAKPVIRDTGKVTSEERKQNGDRRWVVIEVR